MYFRLAIPSLKTTVQNKSDANSKPTKNTSPSKAQNNTNASGSLALWGTRDAFDKPETSRLNGQQKILLQAGIGQTGGYAGMCLAGAMGGASLGAQYSAGNPYIVGGSAVVGCLTGIGAEYIDQSNDSDASSCGDTATNSSEAEAQDATSSETEATESTETTETEETEETEESSETNTCSEEDETTDTSDDEDDDDLGCVYDGGAMFTNEVDHLAIGLSVQTQSLGHHQR